MGLVPPLRRFRAALILLLLVASTVALLAPSPSQAAKSRLTDPAKIEKLAAHAYTWGLAPEFIYRFSKFNNLVTSKRNTLGGGGNAAAWNNNATNAGDASVLYLNSMIDLSGAKRRGNTKELVLTVPPSKSDYYVVNLLDSFINSYGSIGTRTTPSAREQNYLLVGPTSQYAKRRFVKIKGFRYRVMASDTNLNWMLIRVRADTLVPSSNPASAANISKNVVGRFSMMPLRRFQARGHKPKYFTPGSLNPSERQQQRASIWQNAPLKSIRFFKQVGASLRMSPMPTVRTGLNGSPMRLLPAWVVPQAGAKKVFFNPSFGQRRTLKSFALLGLSERGFRIPSNWHKRQRAALERGFQQGRTRANRALSQVAVGPDTNYWSYLNDNMGTYANTVEGYLYRALVVLSGGAANIPLDAIYAQINNLDGTSATQLDGNSTYKLTFLPPAGNSSPLPAVGILPPTVNDSQGDARGFWSLHVYQTDAQQAAAPFITQVSVLNTAYSSANLEVVAVDAGAETLTVKPTDWAPMVASMPVLFGPTATQYGLTPDQPYYIATDPVTNPDGTRSFGISAQWQQQLSDDNVPIQGKNGKPGPSVDLVDPGGPVNLTWGPIQPVSQLGSQQLTSGSLAKNPDGSVTLWIGPELPAGAPATNWLPTPSQAYNEWLYGSNVSSTTPLIRPMIRIYYPTPGSNTEPSILPPPNGSMKATYVLPSLEQVK